MKKKAGGANETRQRVLVIAHTTAQFDVFTRRQGVNLRLVNRVVEAAQMRGYFRTESPLVLLPGWEQAFEEARRLVTGWMNKGGKVLFVSEEHVASGEWLVDAWGLVNDE